MNDAISHNLITKEILFALELPLHPVLQAARLLLAHLEQTGQVSFLLALKCHHVNSADLGDFVCSVPGHNNKANITIKRVTQIFWFPSAYKSSVYTIL